MWMSWMYLHSRGFLRHLRTGESRLITYNYKPLLDSTAFGLAVEWRVFFFTMTVDRESKADSGRSIIIGDQFLGPIKMHPVVQCKHTHSAYRVRSTSSACTMLASHSPTLGKTLELQTKVPSHSLFLASAKARMAMRALLPWPTKISHLMTDARRITSRSK